MPIVITAAQAADMPAILALLERSGLPPDGLREHVATTLVARDGARVVGSAALELYGTGALLRSVAVAAELLPWRPNSVARSPLAARRVGELRPMRAIPSHGIIQKRKIHKLLIPHQQQLIGALEQCTVADIRHPRQPQAA